MDMATLQAWLPTLAATGAFGLLWGDMRSTKRQLGAKLDELSDALKRALYRDDGTTIYVPRQSCEREQARCQSITCGKIEALSVKMDLMDVKREQAKEQQANQMGDMREAIAVLSQRVGQLSDGMSGRFVK